MNKCINCQERQLGCHANCTSYAELKRQKEIENKRYREFNSSVGWDGYIKHNKKYRTV